MPSQRDNPSQSGAQPQRGPGQQQQQQQQRGGAGGGPGGGTGGPGSQPGQQQRQSTQRPMPDIDPATGKPRQGQPESQPHGRMEEDELDEEEKGV